MRHSPSCVERPLTNAQPPLGWAHAGDFGTAAAPFARFDVFHRLPTL